GGRAGVPPSRAAPRAGGFRVAGPGFRSGPTRILGGGSYAARATLRARRAAHAVVLLRASLRGRRRARTTGHGERPSARAPDRSGSTRGAGRPPPERGILVSGDGPASVGG